MTALEDGPRLAGWSGVALAGASFASLLGATSLYGAGSSELPADLRWRAPLLGAATGPGFVVLSLLVGSLVLLVRFGDRIPSGAASGGCLLVILAASLHALGHGLTLVDLVGDAGFYGGVPAGARAATAVATGVESVVAVLVALLAIRWGSERGGDVRGGHAAEVEA